MHLLAKEEYGLRCLLQVAKNKGPRPLTIPEIAEAEGLSPEYTAKLMRALRKGQLVKSTRGASGGYHLARPASQITPWEVLQVLGGTFFSETFCESHPGQLKDCVHNTDCAMRALWTRIESVVREYLEGITLDTLQRDEERMLLSLGEQVAPLSRSPDSSSPGPDSPVGLDPPVGTAE